MQVSKRSSLALTGLLSLALVAAVVRDIYVDWVLEAKPLWSTLLENAVPGTLAVVIGIAGVLVATRENREYVQTVTKWQYAGAVGILVVALEVVGLQLIQGELKPRLIVVQMTIGGAIAGTLVGYASARRNDAQKRLERERDKFESLFQNSPAQSVEVTIVDGRPVVREINSAFEEMFGFAPAQARERLLFEVVDHDEAAEEAICTAISAGEQRELEIHTATENGSRDFQLRVVPFGDEQAYLLYTDVTELRQATAELEATVDRLESSNDRLQQFAYVASHDLQEPARMVSSYVSLLDDEYGEEFDEEAREYMEFAVDGADRMQEMIDDLLDYSRVRTQAEEFTETDTEEIVSETLKDLELLIEDHDVAVTRDDLPTVEADRNQLGQVFQNLIENAIEHGGDEIHVGAERRDGEVVFSVTDDGPGIPENRKERIFELFEQGDRDNDGTGIGLAICDRIVDRHGGEMWVESEAGEGATFSFSIPF